MPDDPNIIPGGTTSPLDEIATSLLSNPDEDDNAGEAVGRSPNLNEAAGDRDEEDYTQHDGAISDHDFEDDLDEEDYDAGGDGDEEIHEDDLSDLLGPTPAQASDGLTEEDFDDGDDELVFDMPIDGGHQEMTWAEIKQQIALGGASQKRLQEATEERNRAYTEAMEPARREAEQYLAAAQQQAHTIAQVYEQFNTALFAPSVEPPDRSMEDTDPIGYLKQLEAWRIDQADIERKQAAAQQVMAQAQDMRARQQQEHLQREMMALRQKVPALSDPRRAEEYQALVYEGGRTAGFTDAEIAQAPDHRLLIMAAKAAAYDRMNANGAPVAPREAAQRQRTRRAMAPGSGGRTRRISKRRQHDALVAQAKRTGSVDDVSALLLQEK